MWWTRLVLHPPILLPALHPSLSSPVAVVTLGVLSRTQAPSHIPAFTTIILEPWRKIGKSMDIQTSGLSSGEGINRVPVNCFYFVSNTCCLVSVFTSLFFGPKYQRFDWHDGWEGVKGRVKDDLVQVQRGICHFFLGFWAGPEWKEVREAGCAKVRVTSGALAEISQTEGLFTSPVWSPVSVKVYTLLYRQSFLLPVKTPLHLRSAVSPDQNRRRTGFSGKLK